MKNSNPTFEKIFSEISNAFGINILKEESGVVEEIRFEIH